MEKLWRLPLGEIRRKRSPQEQGISFAAVQPLGILYAEGRSVLALSDRGCAFPFAPYAAPTRGLGRGGSGGEQPTSSERVGSARLRRAAD